jgi:hypothetical protein
MATAWELQEARDPQSLVVSQPPCTRVGSCRQQGRNGARLLEELGERAGCASCRCASKERLWQSQAGRRPLRTEMATPAVLFARSPSPSKYQMVPEIPPARFSVRVSSSLGEQTDSEVGMQSGFG